MTKLPDTFYAPNVYEKAIVDWSWELPAWKGTKITPMDVDQWTERKGYFFLKEVKYPNVIIPAGQQYAYEAFIKTTQGSGIVGVQTGYTYDTISKMELWYWGSEDGTLTTSSGVQIHKKMYNPCNGAKAYEITAWWRELIENGGY